MISAPSLAPALDCGRITRNPDRNSGVPNRIQLLMIRLSEILLENRAVGSKHKLRGAIAGPRLRLSDVVILGNGEEGRVGSSRRRMRRRSPCEDSEWPTWEEESLNSHPSSRACKSLCCRSIVTPSPTPEARQRAATYPLSHLAVSSIL